MDNVEKEIRQLKRQVDMMHSQSVQKFTQIRAKREQLTEFLGGTVVQFNEALDKINERLDAIEKELGIEQS